MVVVNAAESVAAVALTSVVCDEYEPCILDVT